MPDVFTVFLNKDDDDDDDDDETSTSLPSPRAMPRAFELSKIDLFSKALDSSLVELVLGFEQIACKRHSTR